MAQISFDTFRTYIEETENEELLEPTLEHLADPSFWMGVGTGLLQYIDRRIEDPEPFDWYEHFLDKTIEALEYSRYLAQQAQLHDPVLQTMVPVYLAQAYSARGKMSIANGTYDAAFLDFDAAVLHHPVRIYQELRSQALAKLSEK